MPQGKGTYGNQVGRPSKNKKNMLQPGDPKKTKKEGSMTRTVKKLVHQKEKTPYSKTERKEHVPQTVKDKQAKFNQKTQPGAGPSKRTTSPGPRSEGPRGKGTGWAN